VTGEPLRSGRRTARADPRLGHAGLFDAGMNTQMAAELPEDARRDYFRRADMPQRWLEAVLENQPSYRAREKSVALCFTDLPASMVTEFTWAIERQVRLGMRIHAQTTTRLTRQIALVLAGPRYRAVASLTDLSREEWMQAIRKARMRDDRPLTLAGLRNMDTLLGRHLDLLVHAYHQGPWWELNVWNPLLDARIPLRDHEPQRTSLIHFSHLTTPWLREGAKWWLSRQLEREIYTWSTVYSRQWNLVWFQRYLDAAGCDGPHLLDDPSGLGPWVQRFREWLRVQQTTHVAHKGKLLGPTQRRAAMTALEQLYRFMFEEGDEAAAVLGEPRWRQLGPHHAILFRYGDKPTGPRRPPPEAVLSDAVITRIAENSGLLAQPAREGGSGDEQLVRILGLLIKTGRRLSEITMLDFSPLIAVPFPDPGGHVARLRYQQTKIITAGNTIPVDQETADLIRQQQDWARAFMARQGRGGTDPGYLFLARASNRNGDLPYPSGMARPRLAELARRIDLRDEQGNPVRLSRTHNFRHTKATSLLNAGVPIHVAMRYMGHKTPGMFMHYAQTRAEVAEAEFLRYKKITADGRDYGRDPREMFESLALDKRTDRILPNGYCTLPPRRSCDKGNACLSCAKFVTDQSFAPVLEQQRQETLQLIGRRQDAHAQRYGEPMTNDNIWLRGRREEATALNSILSAIGTARNDDGTAVPVRGAGAPQHRSVTSDDSGKDTSS
jgi:integrase